MREQPLRSLFIASIGNPGRYRTTRHSAGHILLDAVTPFLRTQLPSTYKSWYSPSLMNESGVKLIRELNSFIKLDHQDTHLSTLVILHDELEAPLGKVCVKRGGPESASLRGHRGLKSIFQCLEKKKLYPQSPGFMGRKGNPRLSVLRIGVGIGRPKSRTPDDVANYVLSKLEGVELDAVRKAAVPVVNILAEEAWGSGKENPTTKPKDQVEQEK